MFSVWQPAPIHDRLDEIGVQWMHIPGTGVDGWPRELLAGRTVTCARGVSAVPIAEYVLAAMLAFEKDMPKIFLEEKPEHWNFAQLGELVGQDRRHRRAGRHRRSRRVARTLAFDCRVRALRRRPEQGAPPGVELATDLADLLATRRPRGDRGAGHRARRSTCSTTPPSTSMKPGVHLVNIARGSLVDQDALRRALDDGRVAMATLDTVTPEPLPEAALAVRAPEGAGHRPRVVELAARVGPHARVASPTTSPASSAGEPLDGVVDPDEGY